MGRYADADTLYRASVKIAKDVQGERHPIYATQLSNLATLLQDAGRLAEAEPILREAMETTRAVLGEAHPPYALVLNNLAVLLEAGGRNAEAASAYREAFAGFRAAFRRRASEHEDGRPKLFRLGASQAGDHLRGGDGR